MEEWLVNQDARAATKKKGMGISKVGRQGTGEKTWKQFCASGTSMKAFKTTVVGQDR